MPLAYIFWMLMILWLIFGVGYPWVAPAPNPYVVRGGSQRQQSIAVCFVGLVGIVSIR